jgi:hypothetical protein
MKRITLAAIVVAFLATAAPAVAFPVVICVPKAEGAAVITPTKGACAAEYTKQYAMGGAEKEIFSYMTWNPKGIDEKPTIGFTGVNIQITNLASKDSETNGTGNLIIGLNKEATLIPQTGSANLVIGSFDEYTGYDGIVQGTSNGIANGDSDAIGGTHNSGSGGGVSVGGESNITSHEGVAVGGFANEAVGVLSATLGGRITDASGEESAVVGGAGGKATSLYSAVFGGESDEASAQAATAIGGAKIKATKAKEFAHG